MTASRTTGSIGKACVVCVTCSLGSSAVYAQAPPSEATETPVKSADASLVSFGVGAGFGLGTQRLGALAGNAWVAANGWPWPCVGFGARAGVFGGGEPDGRGTDGKYLAGVLSYRHALTAQRTVIGPANAAFVGSLGIGYARMSGYERRSDPDTSFDLAALVLAPEVALIGHW